jgi:condensin complex subunit 1
MTVISHLILNDMLKLKGEIVDISMLLESDDHKLKDLVNLFFYELNQKGNNYIYNVIPKALARLSSEYKHLEYGRFQNIVKTLLKHVEKDKHTDSLIEKLFAKLKNSSGKNNKIFILFYIIL